MNILGFISWDVAPELITWPITLLYYSLFFAISFLIGFYLMKKMMQKENAPENWTDLIFFYVFIATIVGARLGHVLFYQPDYYLSNPIEILKIWEGGLASHGAAIAVIIALWIYAKRVTKKSFFYGADKVVVTIAIAAAFIRLGNLANSEIIGERSVSSTALFFEYEAKKNATNIITNQIGVEQYFSIYDLSFERTDKQIDTLNFTYPLANLKMVLAPKENAVDNMDKAMYIGKSFIKLSDSFIDSTEYHYFSPHRIPNVYQAGNYFVVEVPVGIIPRFPTQIWESLSYFVLFFILMFGYWKKQWFRREGLLFGVFLVFLFGARFIIEFWKEEQTDLTGESSITMGQWLSIPAVIVGAFIIYRALKNEPLPLSAYQHPKEDEIINKKN
jgi:phosphatidylglycerol:prolipoprotein diacylglycerol transferase